MGCSDSKFYEPMMGPPYWTKNMYYDESMAVGFNAVSEGINNISENHLVVKRLGSHTTDGARWAAPMKSGKHVFEVIWPIKKNRGFNSCIGVGTAKCPLTSKGRVSLVGMTSRGWCLDMSKRRVVHTNQIVGQQVRLIPDKFYMYVDIDSGKVGFGEDIMMKGHATPFYDYAISNIQSDPEDPLFLMVSSCQTGENMQVIYRGSHAPNGGYDLVDYILGLGKPQPPVGQQLNQPKY